MKKILLSLVSILLFNCSPEPTPTMYTLSVTSNPTEGGTISPSGGEYEDGTVLTIRVTPNTNYEFDRWSGSVSGGETSLSITMDSNKSIVGNFVLSDTDGDGVTDNIDQDNNTRSGVPVDDNGVMLNPVYLDENGVTIKNREWGIVGDDGVIDGVEYTIGDRSYIQNWLSEGRNLNQLCTSLITDMNYIFYDSQSNLDISNWDVSNVIDMENMFQNSQFNGDISNWDTSNVISTQDMFSNSPFNGDISNWNVSNVTNMYGMFGGSQFNGNISSWDVSSVTLMNYMFNNSQFNGDISNWDTSNVISTPNMFSSSQFNGDISNWDVSNVTEMDYMFFNSQFNQDLSSWDVSNVTQCNLFSHTTPQWTLPKPNFTNCDPN